MKTYLTRIIVIAALVVAGSWLWSNRDRIAVLSNNNVRIQGDWHKVEMDFSDPDVYTFTETFISLAGEEWASYKLLRGSRIEITTNAAVTIYELDFPDDENMVWSLRKGDKVIPSVRWRR
jgi:hypothetical protein